MLLQIASIGALRIEASSSDLSQWYLNLLMAPRVSSCRLGIKRVVTEAGADVSE